MYTYTYILLHTYKYIYIYIYIYIHTSPCVSPCPSVHTSLDDFPHTLTQTYYGHRVYRNVDRGIDGYIDG